jgi:SAM-dependent methyltransferase
VTSGVDDIGVFLSGERLYGEDLSQPEMEQWYADEAEGYASLGAAEGPSYVYHALNERHGFRFLPTRYFPSVLGLGSAWAEEFVPIRKRIGRITVVEPSAAFTRASLDGVPLQYVRPGPLGALPLAAEDYDLATCFGVLHHIPNVSFVIGQLAKCLRPGGYLLVREPVVSMGDWRRPRSGLTRHERGIPVRLLRTMFEAAGLEVIRERPFGFAPVLRFGRALGIAPFLSPTLTLLDDVACTVFRFNLRYHAGSTLQKIGPTNAYFVLRRPET